MPKAEDSETFLTAKAQRTQRRANTEEDRITGIRTYAVDPSKPVLTGIWMHRGKVGKARSFPNPQKTANCVSPKV